VTRGSRTKGRKTLLTGWFSFLHGETTAGDELALRTVEKLLRDGGTAYDTAWSPAFRPGALHLDEADPLHYTHLVFVCGPLHGPQIEALHERYADCYRIAVGTSVIDPESAAVRGFHRVLARDGGPTAGIVDLAALAPPTRPVPVVGVVLTSGQGEYGRLRRHEQVAGRLTDWLARRDCARLALDTRLDAGDWRYCATPGQFLSAVARLDLVVTDRLHGLVLGLRAGVPVLAVDPVAGGAKVTAQAHACRWPALVPAEAAREEELDRWWEWCLGPGRDLATRRSAEFTADPPHT
jgi:hypothetical protein